MRHGEAAFVDRGPALSRDPLRPQTRERQRRYGPNSMTRSKVASGPKVTRRRWPPSARALDALIAEAIVDAYGDAEQRVGFLTMLEERLEIPFEVQILGTLAKVERIDVIDDQILAICRSGRSRQAIPILELPLPDPRPNGAEWIEAYRRWVRGG